MLKLKLCAEEDVAGLVIGLAGARLRIGGEGELGKESQIRPGADRR